MNTPVEIPIQIILDQIIEIRKTEGKYYNVDYQRKSLEDFSTVTDFKSFFNKRDCLIFKYPHEQLSIEAERFLDWHLFRLCKEYIVKSNGKSNEEILSAAFKFFDFGLAKAIAHEVKTYNVEKIEDKDKKEKIEKINKPKEVSTKIIINQILKIKDSSETSFNIGYLKQILEEISIASNFKDFFLRRDILIQIYSEDCFSKEAKQFCDWHLFRLCKSFIVDSDGRKNDEVMSAALKLYDFKLAKEVYKLKVLAKHKNLDSFNKELEHHHDENIYSVINENVIGKSISQQREISIQPKTKDTYDKYYISRKIVNLKNVHNTYKLCESLKKIKAYYSTSKLPEDLKVHLDQQSYRICLECLMKEKDEEGNCMERVCEEFYDEQLKNRILKWKSKKRQKRLKQVLDEYKIYFFNDGEYDGEYIRKFIEKIESEIKEADEEKLYTFFAYLILSVLILFFMILINDIFIVFLLVAMIVNVFRALVGKGQ